MSEHRSDSYVLLAMGIAVTAAAASILHSIQIITDFDPDTTSTLTIIGSTFSQISVAMAMLCAVIIGRGMVTRAAATLRFEPGPRRDSERSV